MKNNVIEYYSKSNYGITSFYLADKAFASLIARLTGKKTVNEIDLAVIRTITGRESRLTINPNI